jgi:hypothetical protein
MAAGHPGSVRHLEAVSRGSAKSSPARTVAWHVPARPRGRGAYLMARVWRPLRTPFGTVTTKTHFGQPVWVPVLRHRGVHGILLVPLGPSGRRVHANLRRMPLRWTLTHLGPSANRYPTP